MITQMKHWKTDNIIGLIFTTSNHSQYAKPVISAEHTFNKIFNVLNLEKKNKK